jgi:hypothetical protein
LRCGWPRDRSVSPITRLWRLDLRNLFAPEHEAGAGLTYVSIGRPTPALG